MEKRLVLPFESIQSLPGGINEVRLYHDDLLDVNRVSKRFDRSMLDVTVLPEASTLQAIDHQNVVKVSLAVEVDGYDPTMDVIEIHTPYYPRGSITDALLRNETFAGPDALAIMQSALRGLRELHVTHRVLHRDIKSGNILLDDAPVHALVADIGVAGRLSQDGTAPTVDNPTPYSPPEFIDSVLTVSADLYSMGLVLRELIGGRFSYETITRHEVLERLEKGQRALPDEVLKLPVWVTRRLRRVYQKAIKVDPALRYQSAREMSGELAKITLAQWAQVAPNVWTARANARSKILTVTATPDGGGVRLSMTRLTRSGPRRFPGQPDEVVPSLDHQLAFRFFDQANSFAIRTT
jgi:serine/threonine protein kinase